MTERSALNDAKREWVMEGKIEKTLEIAQRALEIGIPVEDISQLTGLPESQIANSCRQ